MGRYSDEAEYPFELLTAIHNGMTWCIKELKDREDFEFLKGLRAEVQEEIRLRAQARRVRMEFAIRGKLYPITVEI